MAERAFQILAGLLAITAGYFYWTGNIEAMYVTAVLGCVAFFLSVRVQVRRRVNALDAEIRARNADARDQISEDQESRSPAADNSFSPIPELPDTEKQIVGLNSNRESD